MNVAEKVACVGGKNQNLSINRECERSPEEALVFLF